MEGRNQKVNFNYKKKKMISSLTCIGGYSINNFDINLQEDNSKHQFKKSSFRYLASLGKMIDKYHKLSTFNW